jgi:hypothetical protein
VNWEAVHTAMTALMALAGIANYIVLQAIRLELAKLDGRLKEWARDQFADKHETHRRLDVLEARFDK